MEWPEGVRKRWSRSRSRREPGRRRCSRGERWASERIRHEVDRHLADPKARGDHSLDEAARSLVAWPVYGDIGGVLLVSAAGEVYVRDNDTMELRVEEDEDWRCRAWVAAAGLAPELKALLPVRTPGAPGCAACGGSGHIQVTPTCGLCCGECMGLGWIRQGSPSIRQLRRPD